MINNFQWLIDNLSQANVMSPEVQARLRKLNHLEREELAFKTGSMVVYFDQEVAAVRLAEEVASKAALPHNYDSIDLNVLNIGAGGRDVDRHFLAVDLARSPMEGSGAHHLMSESALLSNLDQLPFRENSIDAIVSLHTLEHSGDPVKTINHWINLIKPGGGIGVVVPDWRYTWDARHDHSIYGHKWNPTPDLIYKLYKMHWSENAKLEAIDTYSWKLSFDFVMRKHGQFTAFKPLVGKTGADQYKAGTFLQGE
jgi:predicted SAM-dependent methyltransferase